MNEYMDAYDYGWIWMNMNIFGWIWMYMDEIKIKTDENWWNRINMDKKVSWGRRNMVEYRWKLMNKDEYGYK